MCDIKTLEGDCSRNPAGTYDFLHMIPVTEIDSMDPPAAASKTLPAITLDGTSTGWRKIPIIQNTGSVVDTAVGEVQGKSYENMANFTVAGTNEAQLLFADATACPCGFVMIVPERSGNYRVVGNKLAPAYLETNELTTGAANTDRRAGTYAFKAITGYTSPLYDIETNPLTEAPAP